MSPRVPRLSRSFRSALAMAGLLIAPLAITAHGVEATAAPLPDPPTNVTAYPGDSRALVTWDPPANTVGPGATAGPVLSYTVSAKHYSPEDHGLGATTSQTVGGGTTSALFTGLINTDSQIGFCCPQQAFYSLYVFTVTATNATGTGPTSPVPPSASTYPSRRANFLQVLYVDAVQRPADASGLNYWNNSMAGSSAGDRLAVARSFIFGGEHWSRLVTYDYTHYLGRPPDPDGLSFWVRSLQSGAADEQVVISFASSQEYFARAGGTNAGFVHQLYQDVLNRPGDPPGEVYWGDRLTAGLTRAQVVSAFTYSDEYRSLLVTYLYSTYLDRLPDSGGLAYFIDRLRTGSRDEDLAVSLAVSSEYYAINAWDPS